MRRSAELNQPVLVNDDVESDSNVEEESTGRMNGVVLNKQPKERLLRTKSECEDQERKVCFQGTNSMKTVLEHSPVSFIDTPVLSIILRVRGLLQMFSPMFFVFMLRFLQISSRI